MSIVAFTLTIFMLVFLGLSALSYILNFSVIQKQRRILLELDEDRIVRQSENF